MSDFEEPSAGREYPPWDTFLRVDEFSKAHGARGCSNGRFFRRYLAHGLFGLFRTLVYLLVLFVLAVAVGELTGLGADRMGGTLPMVVVFAVLAELLTRLFERLFGRPSDEKFGVRMRSLKRDARVIGWCGGRYDPARDDDGGVLAALSEAFCLAFAGMREVGAALGDVFGRADGDARRQ